ncbi:DUF1501 domain-containing protein [Anatilimnocola sp. NA78]|uniref:DUF1501 domain-containing protein n=1 Tax=Anatilimnocola sp. NA78 TaxID=3415683 RepID=UPI003CE474A2
MPLRCNPGEHFSRRALMQSVLGVGAGGVVMNWGGLTQTTLAEEVRKQKKHCIYLFMNGGASQFETFDMKVGQRTGGPFREISTNIPGSRVCELMPKLSQQMDQVAVIRSMKTSEVDHPGGIYLMHTGYRPTPNVRFPEFGSIIAKYQGSEQTDLPNFIKIFGHGDAGSGFLGPKYQPFGISPEGSLPTFAASNMPVEKELRRHEVRAFLEDQFAAAHKTELARTHRESYEAARRLGSARKVFNIDDEWEKNRELYGDSAMGRRCLLARRLVEAGVPFIEVGQSGYDTHGDNFTGHRGLVPSMEHAWAGLMTDLKQRGLFDSTLIVWAGEIGRTPSINNRAGRDHYVRCWTAALAGCGIKGGQMYGESDADGVEVKSNPVTEGDFFATIYQALSIDPKAENYTGVRPIPLAPFGSKVVSDLLA